VKKYFNKNWKRTINDYFIGTSHQIATFAPNFFTGFQILVLID
jgi:hypothetical protein